MSHLDDRKIDILDFIIRDYIRHGIPVASKRVHDENSMNSSPATIRNIMCELDDDGYLDQPHTSGGRVPTDKAYRYFVDSLMEILEPGTAHLDMLDDMVDKTISESTKLFTIMAGFGRKKNLSFYGAQRIFSEPEFIHQDVLRGFAAMFDNLYEISDAYRQMLKDEEEAFIGKENPLKETRNMSVVACKTYNKGEESVLLIVGPKRMNYEYNCSILHNYLEQNKK